LRDADLDVSQRVASVDEVGDLESSGPQRRKRSSAVVVSCKSSTSLSARRCVTLALSTVPLRISVAALRKSSRSRPAAPGAVGIGVAGLGQMQQPERIIWQLAPVSRWQDDDLKAGVRRLHRPPVAGACCDANGG